MLDRLVEEYEAVDPYYTALFVRGAVQRFFDPDQGPSNEEIINELDKDLMNVGAVDKIPGLSFKRHFCFEIMETAAATLAEVAKYNGVNQVTPEQIVDLVTETRWFNDIYGDECDMDGLDLERKTNSVLNGLKEKVRSGRLVAPSAFWKMPVLPNP